MAHTTIYFLGRFAAKSADELGLLFLGPWRRWRQQVARRALARCVLNETRDPMVLADAGMAQPLPSLLERIPMSLIAIQQ